MFALGRDRMDSIPAYKKQFDRAMTVPEHLNDHQDFDSPRMSPDLTGAAMGMPFGGYFGLGTQNNHFQNVLLQQLGPGRQNMATTGLLHGQFPVPG